MATYDYQIAKTVLTDVEKDRILCIYLNRRPDGTIDWDKAAEDFGSASVNSMKVSLTNGFKKVEKHGGKVDGDGNATVAATPATPATPKKGSGKKRAASPGGDDEETPPAPKKGRKKKTVKEAPVDSVEEDATKDEAAAVVKSEVED